MSIQSSTGNACALSHVGCCEYEKPVNEDRHRFLRDLAGGQNGAKSMNIQAT